MMSDDAPERNAKILALAEQLSTAQLAERFGLSTRQIENIKQKAVPCRLAAGLERIETSLDEKAPRHGV